MSSVDPRLVSASTGNEHLHRPGARTFLAVNLGNALEWYDWSIFAVFAVYFADDFFGNGDGVSSLLSTLATFAAGFVMRPLGGLVFGRIADRRGRRGVLVLTMMIVAAGSILLALSPTYRQIGLGASVWLLVLRCAQGFAHGGELGGAYTYIAEIAPAAKRGLWGSTVTMSTVVGTVLATLVGALLRTGISEEQMGAWGWRVPFVIGGLLALLGLWLRRGLHEPEVFTRSAETVAADRRVTGLWAHRGALLRVVAIVAGSTMINYVWSVNAPAYAISFHGMNDTAALWVGMGANLLFLSTLPLAGMISDRYGRKFNLIVWGIGSAALAFPLSALLGPHPMSLLLAMMLALVVQSFSGSIQVALFAELFSTRARAAGVGLAVSISAAIFGGTAPYLDSWLTARGFPEVFTGYAVVLALIGILALVRMPETKGIDLGVHSGLSTRLR
ncbi:MFS transporter [Sciscionella marina]|uniref:MFS transporter n=1 Tax=Sciscionella marina TaxID=508770 RepID=UPI00036A09E4|nr:MFS transporter [Sciscionella marina]